MCAGTRVAAGSIIRDVSQGRAMASILSLVFTVFMIVPIIAPAIGTLIMVYLPWEWIFGVVSVGYMCASGVIFGCLFAFIGASEQVFDEVFERGDKFWIWFAGIASVLAIMNFLNSRAVERLGMRRISHGVVLIFILLSLINLFWMQFMGTEFWVFYILFALTFGCFGMMGANFASLALEPMGKVAGTANSVYGFATSTVSSLLGIIVARAFDGTVRPLLISFVILGVSSLIIIAITERGKLFDVGEGKA